MKWHLPDIFNSRNKNTKIVAINGMSICCNSEVEIVGKVKLHLKCMKCGKKDCGLSLIPQPKR